MQPTLCARCKKNVAVIFITKIENGVSTNEGLCLKCAKELNIKPVDDIMKKMGISDDDLEGLSSEMMEAFGDDVDAFIFPASDKGQWTSLGDTENVILSSTEHPEAAFEFMKYMATGAGEEMWCEASGNVPVSETVQKMDFVQNNKFLQISIGGIDVAGILPCNPTTSEFISEWPNIVAQGLEGTKTAEQVCNELQALLWP